MSQVVKETRTLTFATLSGPVYKTEILALDVNELVSIELGADLAGTTITLEGCSDPDGTPVPVYTWNQSATPVAVTITHTTLTARVYLFNPNVFIGLKNIRFQSNASGDSAKTIKVNLKRI